MTTKKPKTPMTPPAVSRIHRAEAIKSPTGGVKKNSFTARAQKTVARRKKNK